MTFISAIILLGILIFVHELGHFLFAKLVNVKVLRFSLGFGPKLIGKQYGDTEYRISLVPLGGYVKMLGEETEEELTEIVGAFLQYYREEAHYAERTHTFMERLGIEHVRRVIVEDSEEREKLVKRINIALAVAKDPWKERVAEAAA